MSVDGIPQGGWLVDEQRALPLFGEAAESKRDRQQTGQIQYSDEAMLDWIAAHTSDAGKGLIGLVKERRLFKRLVVFARERLVDA